MADSTGWYTEPRKVIRGPYSFFNGSFIVEILESFPEDNCSTLLRATYPPHPLLSLGPNHPQAPPLHLHFDQIESFKVLSGKMGCKLGYEQKEILLTEDNTPFDVQPMVPHAPYPMGEGSFILKVHPRVQGDEMGDEFFEGLFGYLDFVWREGRGMDLVRVSVCQDEAASAPVILPGWTVLGPLRWWVPWKVQGLLAWIGRLRGYEGDLRGYLKK